MSNLHFRFKWTIPLGKQINHPHRRDSSECAVDYEKFRKPSVKALKGSKAALSR
jgi:hypothetical protein